MRTTNPEKFARKREEILEAASRCFARDGFHGASVSSICAEAGISPGHIYHYFASKEAIVGAIIEARLADKVAGFERVLRSDDLVGAIIVEIESIKMGARNAGLKRQLMLEMIAEGGRNPTIANMLVEHNRTIRELLAELLRRAQERGQVDAALDPEPAAAVLLSVIECAGTLTTNNPTLAPEHNLEHLKLLIKRFLVSGSSVARAADPVE